MSTKTSIRYFNALAAVCYDHCILDDYDFSFQDMERNFNLCGRDDLIIILVKSTHVKTFLDVVSDIVPAQFERATALITGIVLSANGNTIAHEFANSSNRETDDSGSTYPFPYAMNLTCKNDIFTLCVVCAKSEQYEELLDELIDDAAHLITKHGANLPVGYIPAHVLNNAPKKTTENVVEEYSDSDEDVNEVIKNASASLFSIEDDDSEELNVATIHPNDDVTSREVCRIVSNILTESQVNDIISRQIIDITNDIETVYDISRTVNKDYDPQVAVKFDNIYLLFTDLMCDLQKREIHQEQHDNEFLLFDVTSNLEDIRNHYFTDLRNLSTLGIYRTIVADTELRAEWFLASITVDNYTDIIRLMFPRQYNGITTGYIKEFFEELLNNPTDNELYFALDNGFYKVKFAVADAIHNPTLLARVECNFPVTPHNTDSDES